MKNTNKTQKQTQIERALAESDKSLHLEGGVN